MPDLNSGLDALCAEIDSILLAKNDASDIDTCAPEKHNAAVMDKEAAEEPCVCGACVMCKNATADSTPVHMIKNGQRVEISGRSELNKKDILMEVPFAGCTTTEDQICGVKAENIEDGEWQGVDETKSQGQDLETLKSQSSYMVCTKGWGMIYFVDAGQQVKDFVDELSVFMDHLQKQFGFDRRTVGVLGEIYRKIQEKYPTETQREWGWRFARSLSQMASYDNMIVLGEETDAWVRGAGEAIEYGEEKHKEFFCDKLGIDEENYTYMRYMVRLQHFMTSNDDYTYSSVLKMSKSFFPNDKSEFQEWKKKMEKAIDDELDKDEYLERYKNIYDAVGQKGDFSHMMYTISANLIDEGKKVENKWDNNLAPIMSWDNAEQRKDIAGWLGDAIYGGTNFKVSFGQDDFIADLDADNIAHLVTDDKSLVDAANEYYNELQKGGEEYRKEVFVENNTYEAIESAIAKKISLEDRNWDKKIDYNDLKRSSRYKDTYEFLKQLAPYSEG
ncbi:MAG: hypothetical protein K1W20_10755 [Lachnospiraceae bacterium]